MFIVVKGYQHEGNFVDKESTRIFYRKDKAEEYQEKLRKNIDMNAYIEVYEVEIGDKISRELINNLYQRDLENQSR